MTTAVHLTSEGSPEAMIGVIEGILCNEIRVLQEFSADPLKAQHASELPALC